MLENKFGFDIKWFIKNISDLNIWTRQERRQQQNERKLMLKFYVDCMLEEAKRDQAGISLLLAVGTVEIQQPFSSSSKNDVNYYRDKTVRVLVDIYIQIFWQIKGICIRNRLRVRWVRNYSTKSCIRNIYAHLLFICDKISIIGNIHINTLQIGCLIKLQADSIE